LRNEQTVLEEPISTDDPHEAAVRGEAVNLVQGFLAQLDEGQAMVFYLADIEGMTAPEIASVLEMKLNSVYGRLRLARLRFEKLLSQRTTMEP